jgi:hypothetical protein
MRKALALLTVGGALLGSALQADAAAKQDGLVNVVVGDVTILEDVNVAVAADVVAQICGVDVGPVAILGTAVDTNSRSQTVCRTDDGKVKIVQN